MSDADIVRSVLRGKHQAFGQLVERHFAAIYALCLSHTRDPADAEDAAQEAFARCYAQLDQLRTPRKFPSWLSTVARNVCRDRLRERPATEVDPSDLADTGAPSAQTLVERKQLGEILRRLVDQLPPETREAVFLFYLEDQSTRDIAALLGKSPNAVARLLKYGREKLRAELWDEAAETLHDARTSPERAKRALAALPLGSAPWWADAPAAGAATTPASWMNSLAAKVAAAAVVPLAALLVWSALSPTDAAPARERAPALIPRTSVTPSGTRAAGDGAAPRASAAPSSSEAVPSRARPDLPPTAPAGIGYSVSGVVMGSDGYPIADAQVFSIEQDRQPLGRVETRTDATGHYRLDGISGDRGARIHAMAAGRVPQFRWVQRGAAPRQDVDFTLPVAAHRIAGRVVDAQGRGLQARIDLRLSGHAVDNPAQGGLFSGQQIFAWSEADGEFDLAVSKAGLQSVAVYAPEYAVSFFRDIPAGTTDARLVLHRGGQLAGRLTWPDGSPAVGLRVRARGDAVMPEMGELTRRWPVKLWFRTVVSDADGRYRMERLSAEQRWTLWVQDAGATAWNSPSKTLALRHDVEISDGETRQLDLVLRSAARLTARVSDRATGRPVSGLLARVRVVSPGDVHHAAAQVGEIWGEARLDADGTASFDLPLDTPHDVSVDVDYLGTAYPRSAFEDGGGRAPVVRMTPGEEHTLDVRVPAPIVLSGRVVDGKERGLEGLSVYLETRFGTTSVGTTDEWGSFEATGLNPRLEYAAFVTDPAQGYVHEVGGRSFREVGRVHGLRGAPGARLKGVEIVVVAKGGIEGQLVDEAGHPMADQRFVARALLRDGEVAVEHGVTDAAGRFVLLRAAPEGRHERIELRTDLGGDAGARALVRNLEIERDVVADVGTLAMRTTADEESDADPLAP